MNDPVWATKVENAFQSEIAGAYTLSDGYILFVCPCGCGSLSNLPIKTGEKTAHSWSWDGNETQPTLSPSIRQMIGCKYHGHLIQGVWSFCEDSGR